MSGGAFDKGPNIVLDSRNRTNLDEPCEDSTFDIPEIKQEIAGLTFSGLELNATQFTLEAGRNRLYYDAGGYAFPPYTGVSSDATRILHVEQDPPIGAPPGSAVRMVDIRLPYSTLPITASVPGATTLVTCVDAHALALANTIAYSPAATPTPAPRIVPAVTNPGWSTPTPTGGLATQFNVTGAGYTFVAGDVLWVPPLPGPTALARLVQSALQSAFNAGSLWSPVAVGYTRVDKYAGRNNQQQGGGVSKSNSFVWSSPTVTRITGGAMSWFFPSGSAVYLGRDVEAIVPWFPRTYVAPNPGNYPLASTLSAVLNYSLSSFTVPQGGLVMDVRATNSPQTPTLVGIPAGNYDGFALAWSIQQAWGVAIADLTRARVTWVPASSPTGESYFELALDADGIPRLFEIACDSNASTLHTLLGMLPVRLRGRTAYRSNIAIAHVVSAQTGLPLAMGRLPATDVTCVANGFTKSLLFHLAPRGVFLKDAADLFSFYTSPDAGRHIVFDMSNQGTRPFALPAIGDVLLVSFDYFNSPAPNGPDGAFYGLVTDVQTGPGNPEFTVLTPITSFTAEGFGGAYVSVSIVRGDPVAFNLYVDHTPKDSGILAQCIPPEVLGTPPNTCSFEAWLPEAQGGGGARGVMSMPNGHQLTGPDYVIVKLTWGDGGGSVHNSNRLDGNTSTASFAYVLMRPECRTERQPEMGFHLRQPQTGIRNMRVRIENPDGTLYRFHGSDYSLVISTKVTTIVGRASESSGLDFAMGIPFTPDMAGNTFRPYDLRAQAQAQQYIMAQQQGGRR
jgi:hypothetical protein